MPFIFISYSHKDSEYANRLADSLEVKGLDVWIDERIDYGARWPQAIQENLDKCAAFVVVMTPDSFESEWVQNELTRARRLRKPIYPLLLEGDVWLALEATHYVDVRGAKLPPPPFYTGLAGVMSAGQAQVSPSNSLPERLRTELGELQRRYDNLTSRIAAVDTDLGRALDSEHKLTLEERRAELAGKRSEVSARMAQIERAGELYRPDVTKTVVEGRGVYGLTDRVPASSPATRLPGKGMTQEPLVVDRPINLGFDGPDYEGYPTGWFNSLGYVDDVSTNYEIRVMSRSDGGVGACVVFQNLMASEDEFGSLMQRCAASFLANKTIRFEGEVRTDRIKGWAGLWLRADGVTLPTLFFDNMQGRPIRGTTPWTRYHLDAQLPKGTAWLNYGVVLSGSGTMWADNFRLLVWNIDRWEEV